MKPKILFNKESISLILEAFDCEIGDNGYIFNSKTKEKILCPEGEELTKENFGGIIKSKKSGETLFLKKNLLTAIKIAENEY